MTSRVAHGLAGVAAARRERLERERTAAQLRRQRELEREVAEQLEPQLGPAGRPVGETAMALWRRRQADAYLALPPWRRAWRTWVSWDRLRRGLATLLVAFAWTLLLLPLRMLGLAGLGASQAGVAVAACAAPIVALMPPRRRGRFAHPLPAPGAPWRRSRAAVRLARAGALVAVLAVAVVAALAVLGPGLATAPHGRITTAARAADAVLVRQAVDARCGPGLAVRLAPLDESHYRVEVAEAPPQTLGVSRDAGFGVGARHVIGTITCPT